MIVTLRQDSFHLASQNKDFHLQPLFHWGATSHGFRSSSNWNAVIVENHHRVARAFSLSWNVGDVHYIAGMNDHRKIQQFTVIRNLGC